MKLILGSSSKWRAGVLKNAGYDFEIMSPDIDEKAIRSDNYYELPTLIARAKADALVSKIIEPAILITADQVVVCAGKLFEKPQSESEAREFLKYYSAGNPAETVSALVVINTKTGERVEGVDIVKIFLKEMPDEFIESYIKTKNIYGNAGGLRVEDDVLAPYIEKMEGTLDSIQGLPLNLLEKLFTQVGFEK